MYSAVPPPRTAEINEAVCNESAAGKSQDDTGSVCGAPPGVSDEKWKKFQELKERREKCCRSKTSDKRIRRLQKQVTNTVFSEMKLPDEIAALEDRGLMAPHPGKRQQQKEKKREGSMSVTRTKDEVQWKQLIHFSSSSVQSLEEGDKKVDKSIKKEKQLNEKLDEAIRQKSFEEAETISMQLVQHNFASRLVKAVECRDYVKRKAAEEERVKNKKKPKLRWGFEQKQRWESKGNM